MPRRFVCLALCALAGCTSAPPRAVPSPTVTLSLSPTPTPSPSPTPRAAFSAARAYATISRLAREAPRRHATSAAYRRAASIMAEAFASSGYTVRRQRFDVPGGTNDRIRVPAGTSQNVIAEPDGFDRSKPHLVVGGHLDAVPDTAGANDNASGPAVIAELARLASIERTRIPIVWVAFGAEERIRGPGLNAYSLGSRAYLKAMTAAERRALKGMINIDMVGAGRNVQIIGSDGPMVASLLAAARKLKIAREVHASIPQGFSDHVQFQNAGYSVGWLWAGNNPTLHRPSDTLAVIQRAELRRIGRVAWQMLRTYRA